jgi:hypothetical protein
MYTYFLRGAIYGLYFLSICNFFHWVIERFMLNMINVRGAYEYLFSKSLTIIYT